MAGREIDLRSTKHEDYSSHLNGSFTREAIGNEGRHQSSEEGAGRHRSRDTTLRARDRVMKVVLVGIGTENAAHRRNVKSKEHATYFEVSMKRREGN